MSTLNKLKNLDSYGYNFGFTYQQQRTYRSWFGATISLMIKLGIFIYTCLLLNEIYQHESFKVTPLEYKRNFYHDTTIYNISSDNIDFAVTLGYNGRNMTVRENIYRYLSVDFRQIWTKWITSDEESEYATVKFTMDSLGSAPCSEDRFGEENIGFGRNLTDSWCVPGSYVMQFSGNEASLERHYFSVTVTYCNQTILDRHFPGQMCASIEESMAIYSDVIAQIDIKQQYFDINEFERNPVKYSFDTIVVQLTEGVSGVGNYAISQNNAILKDSRISESIGVQNISYASTRPKYQFTQKVEYTSQYMYYLFRMDDTVMTIERKAFNLVELLQKIGGMLGSANSFALIFASLIQQSLFYRSLISSFSLPSAIADHSQDEEGSSSEIQLIKGNLLKPHSELSTYTRTYQWLQQKIICCLHKRNQSLEEALSSYKDELDIVRYLSNMRKLDYLISTLLSTNEVYFLQNFKEISLTRSDLQDSNTKGLDYRLQKIQHKNSKHSKIIWKRLKMFGKEMKIKEKPGVARLDVGNEDQRKDQKNLLESVAERFIGDRPAESSKRTKRRLQSIEESSRGTKKLDEERKVPLQVGLTRNKIQSKTRKNK